MIATPPNADGSIDLGTLEAAATATGKALADKPERHLVVIKSTVTPPRSPDTLEPAIREGATDNEAVEVGMNPEFLREGSADDDFQHPDKLVFGTRSDCFEPLLEHHDTPVIATDPETRLDADEVADAGTDR